MAPTRSTSSRSDGRPTFILIARKGQVLVGLAQERVEREVEVDAAGVARHARIEAAQHAPERRALAPRAKIPERDVDGRHRERLGAAAPTVVERPPHRLPVALDEVGVASDQERRQVAGHEGVDGGAPGAHRVRVARALGALGVAHARGDQLEALDGPVRAVRQRDRQRDRVMVGDDLADQHRRVRLT